MISLASCDLVGSIVDFFNEEDESEPFEYNLFYEGLLPVESGDKWIYVDKEGNPAFGKEYRDASNFYGGYALVSEDGEAYQIIKSDGEIMTTVERNLSKDNMIIHTGFYEALVRQLLGYVIEFDDSLHVIVKNGKAGLCKIDGTIVVEPQYLSIEPFQKGINASVVRLDSKYGLVDKNGNYIVQPVYDHMGTYFFDGLLLVRNDGKVGFMNDRGEIVIPLQFESASFFSHGLAYAKLDGKYGYINTKGEFVVEPEFEDAGAFTSDGYAKVKLDGKWGYIDRNGEFIAEPAYDYARDFSGGYAVVKIGELWGIIDSDGEYIVDPAHGYDSIGYFQNGAAAVEKDGFCGFVNGKGVEFVAPRYKKVSHFAKNGLAPVVLENGKYGYINLDGEIVIEPIFDAHVDSKGVYSLPSGCVFYDDGYAVARQNGKFGVINADGEFVVDPIYDRITIP